MLRLVAAGLVGVLLGGFVIALLVGGGGGEERPAPPAKSAVTVLVRAEADVAVTVNGQDRHQTGDRGAVLLVGLWAGQHALSLEAKGFQGKTVSFELEAGQIRLVGPYALEKIPEPTPTAELVVQLSEMFRDAEVTLDGQLVPSAKLGKPMEIPAGKPLKLRVSLLGYEDYIEELQAEKGQKVKTKQIALAEDELGQVSVASTPLGAEVWVNGAKQSCVTPCRVKELNPKKKFTIKLTKDGYRVHEETYAFPPKERTRILVVSLAELAGREEKANQAGARGSPPASGESALSQK